jgi:hypothetical protein
MTKSLWHLKRYDCKEKTIPVYLKRLKQEEKTREEQEIEPPGRVNFVITHQIGGRQIRGRLKIVHEFGLGLPLQTERQNPQPVSIAPPKIR